MSDSLKRSGRTFGRLGHLDLDVLRSDEMSAVGADRHFDRIAEVRPLVTRRLRAD